VAQGRGRPTAIRASHSGRRDRCSGSEAG
jgi:hypothetical protein